MLKNAIFHSIYIYSVDKKSCTQISLEIGFEIYDSCEASVKSHKFWKHRNSLERNRNRRCFWSNLAHNRLACFGGAFVPNLSGKSGRTIILLVLVFFHVNWLNFCFIQKGKWNQVFDLFFVLLFFGTGIGTVTFKIHSSHYKEMKVQNREKNVHFQTIKVKKKQIQRQNRKWIEYLRCGRWTSFQRISFGLLDSSVVQSEEENKEKRKKVKKKTKVVGIF